MHWIGSSVPWHSETKDACTAFLEGRNRMKNRRDPSRKRLCDTMGRYDGVDGPLRHRLCQNEVVEISDKGAVREPDYPHWNGYVEAFFSAARGGCRRADGAPQEASAQPSVGFFFQASAGRYPNGGVRRGPLLGAGVAQARP